jgi:hypothetical protein
MPAPHLPPGFDFTDPDVYAERIPVEELAELRRTAPVWWNEQPQGAEAFSDQGYWLLTRHKDVREVSLRDDVFSSAANCIVPRYPDAESGRGQIEAGRFSMINMDAPQHSRVRKISSGGEGLFELPVYLGFSGEAGNVWAARSDVRFGTARKDESAFLGLDTLLGPVYLGAGYDQQGHTGYYLFLGRTF